MTIPNNSILTLLYDAQLKKVILIAHPLASRLLYSYPTRFSVPVPPEKVKIEMPAMPPAVTKLEDGQYNFLIESVKTQPAAVRNGIQFGPQEEVELLVCDEAWSATGDKTRMWVSHTSRKLIEKIIEANLCKVVRDEEGEPLEWDILPGKRFVGTVIEGKVKGFRRPSKAVRKEEDDE